MATLPGIDSIPDPTVRSAFDSRRQVAPGAANDIPGALQGLGQSMEGLANAYDQRAKESASIQKAQAIAGWQSDSIKIDNQYTLPNDSDYATYSKRSGADLAASRDQWANSIADPKQRAEFLASTEPELTQRATSITTRGAEVGRQKNIEDANTTLDQLKQTAVSTNDPDVVNKSIQAAHDLIDDLEKHGTIAPSEAEKYRRDSAQSIAKLRFEADAVADPAGTLNKMGAGGTYQQAAAILRREENDGYTQTTASYDVNAYRGGYGSDTITKADGTVVPVTKGMVIDKADAERDLQRRLPLLDAQGAKEAGADAWGNLSPNAKAPLMSLMYNHGSLPPTVVAAIQTGDNGKIADAVDALPAWSNKPGIAEELLGRRKREAAIIRGDQPAGEIDPLAKLLSPEDYVSVREQARTQLLSQDAQARAQTARDQAAAKGSYDLGIQTGQLTDPTTFLGDPRLDDTDKATLMSAFNSKNTEYAKTSAALQRVATGGTFNPFDSSDKTDADRILAATGGVGGWLDGDPAAAGRVQAVYNKTNILPPTAVNALRGAISGSDAKQAANAYQFAGQIYHDNPRAFDAVDGGADLARAAAAYNHLTLDGGKSGPDAVTQLRKAYDPDNARTAEALKVPAEAFVKTLTPGDMAGAIGGGWLGFGQPQQGATPEQGAAFAADVADVGRQAFIDAHGDPQAARAATIAGLRGLYSVSNSSGRPALMRMAPELRYPPIAGKTDYIHDEAMKFAGEATGQRVIGPYKAGLGTLAGVPGGTPPPEDGVAGVALAATQQTAADFKAGVPPRYDMVVWNWRNGQKVMGDVVHNFSIQPDRLAELQKQSDAAFNAAAAKGEANTSKANAAISTRRGLEYGGQPEYPDRAPSLSAPPKPPGPVVVPPFAPSTPPSAVAPTPAAPAAAAPQPVTRPGLVNPAPAAPAGPPALPPGNPFGGTLNGKPIGGNPFAPIPGFSPRK